MPAARRLVRVTIADPDAVRPLTGGRRRRSPGPSSSGILTVKVDPRVLREARRLAHGDTSRLVLLTSGAVIVANSPEHRRAIQARLHHHPSAERDEG